MSSKPATGARVALTCLEGEQCTVYLEPWGATFLLRKGDVFYVESPALASGDVEIGNVNGGISLSFMVDVPVTITDRAGRELPI